MKSSIFNGIVVLLVSSMLFFVVPDFVERSMHSAQYNSRAATTNPSLESGASTSPVVTGESITKSATQTTLQPILTPLTKTQAATPNEAVSVKTKTEEVPFVASSEPGALIVTRPTPSATATQTESATPSASGTLNQQGILAIVNSERRKQGLQPLTFNKTLTVIAEVKAVDMIAKQYFAHVAPDGADVAKLAERYNYEYLRIGENLAMGDFDSNEDVMNGWMNSPGHKANILNSEYTEIGISAEQGMHDGRLMWYAVQEFGRPAALCPSPDALLAKKITLYEEQLASLEKTMASLREEIEATSRDQSAYNAKAKDYNTIVDLYNSIVSMTKEAVKTYNAGVEQYNVCIKG